MAICHASIRYSRRNNKKKRAKGAGRKIKATPLSERPVGADNNSQRNDYESVMLATRCICATHDISPGPSGSTLDPFLYWPTAKTEACAAKLIERYQDLVKYAEKHYFGVTEMATKWGSVVARKATNERAIQIQYIKAIWLSSRSPYHFVTNALASEQTVTSASSGPIQLSENIQHSGIESVEDLRNMIKSDKMYTNEVLYDYFCAGLESGRLKQSEQMTPTHIKKLITVAHEAHFRAEIWFALSIPAYHHRPHKQWIATRKAEWQRFLELVYRDRKDNADNAHLRRMQSLDEADQNSDEDNSNNEGLDPKYFKE
jgi:hypothetical protein